MLNTKYNFPFGWVHFTYPVSEYEQLYKESAKYISERVVGRDEIYIFQSSFGYADTDIPFTLVIKRTENGYADVTMWVNDWGTFTIKEIDCFWSTRAWEFNAIYVKRHPDLLKMSYDPYEAFKYDDIWCDGVTKHERVHICELESTVFNMLKSMYDYEDDSFPNDDIRGSVYLIGSYCPELLYNLANYTENSKDGGTV